MIKKDSMRHPRHGHSAVWFGEKFIVVTGSRKEKNQSQVKCEMYNTDLDVWFDMPDLNVGRHYHSSCTFQEKMVFVFCGIANSTRKYINTIERYDHTNRLKWHLIELSNKDFSERQGCGAVQRDNKDILVFGGFAGKFRNDSYLFDTATNTIKPTAAIVNDCFCFQTPTVYDSETKSAYSCEMMQRSVFKFDQRSLWSKHMPIYQQQ
mmetsp:Transcript_11436/g.19322  ORF Transcript_11436/g.19322 Transcript_11436/m.19322 type:complete len:207 (-) Transcript_11436:187-807(-)|eukprot:CAMPEP_0168619520 /NCGR_PEP_ID=MMETSP0449_2-20121227/6644_1 /TAXON_ID=1082188 /ORGANISM="Strombidium rassoulzadegani, Strain ras09" /LENGTH=206 /DNA_ID=CAMNT_0008660457 /DNA_START=658 /DNA_END=1278 /DNA_ORIENTATION=-